MSKNELLKFSSLCLSTGLGLLASGMSNYSFRHILWQIHGYYNRYADLEADRLRVGCFRDFKYHIIHYTLLLFESWGTKTDKWCHLEYDPVCGSTSRYDICFNLNVFCYPGVPSPVSSPTLPVNRCFLLVPTPLWPTRSLLLNSFSWSNNRCMICERTEVRV